MVGFKMAGIGGDQSKMSLCCTGIQREPCDYQCPSARRMLPTPAGPAAMLPDGPAISAGAVMGPARAAGAAAGPANTAPANR